MEIKKVNLSKVELAYEENGPIEGEPLVLVHGWPDSPRTWDKVLPALHAAGYRTLVLYLRGYGPSTFCDTVPGKDIRRTGQPVAFAQDVIEFADQIGLSKFHFIGHDWGARTGYALAALFPERLKSLVAISVPFEPGKAQPPKFPQARAFWYQWLLCTIPGEKKFREDPVAFAQAQWNVWSPTGWYSEKDFKAAAESWSGKDFEDVVLHSYRSRWGHAELDPEYELLQDEFESTKMLDLPTRLIHGAEDHCELLETTEGAEKHFASLYFRDVIEGVGHFPQREAPERVAASILTWIGELS